MEEKFDILEIAKELNAVVVVDEDVKENIDDETIKDIEKHNELMENRREKNISTEEDDEDDYHNDYDLDEKEDVNNWPENLINEIFGFMESYHPNFKEQVSEYFRNEKKVKEAIDVALEGIPDKEAKIIKNYYMEGKSLNEIAKEKKKTTNQIIDLKESALRKLRNPKRARNFRPFFDDIDKTIINK